MGDLFTRERLFRLSANWTTIILQNVSVINVNIFGFYVFQLVLSKLVEKCRC